MRNLRANEEAKILVDEPNKPLQFEFFGNGYNVYRSTPQEAAQNEVSVPYDDLNYVAKVETSSPINPGTLRNAWRWAMENAVNIPAEWEWSFTYDDIYPSKIQKNVYFVAPSHS